MADYCARSRIQIEQIRCYVQEPGNILFTIETRFLCPGFRSNKRWDIAIFVMRSHNNITQTGEVLRQKQRLLRITVSAMAENYERARRCDRRRFIRHIAPPYEDTI